MSWSEVPLHVVANLESGFGFPRERQGDANQEFPFFRVSDMNLEGNEILMSNHTNTVSRQTLEQLHARAFPAGTVIFPKIGAAIATEKKRVLVRPATYDNNVMGAIPKEGVNPKFLYYWFVKLKLTDYASASHVPSIRKSVMEEIPFALPPPSEQRRIVAILDQANALHKRAREADAKAARILPALFLKMFGDPATNPMGWPIHPLRKAIAAIDPGWSAPSEARTRAAHEFGVLKVSAVTSGTFLPSEHKAVTTGVDGRALIAPRKGDLLFSRANTRELVAATCIVEHDEPMLFLSDKLWRVTPDKQEADGLFLKMLLTNEFVRDQIRSKASGSSGSMLNVSQGAVLRTEVTLPPITKQKPFSENAWRALSILRSSEEPARRVEAIWHLLMNRAFSGQLTAKWREAHMQELLAEMQEQARLLNLPAPT